MDVPEIDVTEGPLFNSTTSFKNVQEDNLNVLKGETPGQVYAYRYNDTRVVLGTRRLDVFGAAVGIKVIANGSYQCFASNANETEISALDIIVIGLY